VAELKGEEVREPAEIKLDLPLHANLPVDYVSKEELRLEAYRRLATVTTHSEVDDIENEWLDRYGPVPEPARALLDVARLRAECARTGVREVAVARDVVRLGPLALKTSQTIRVQRLYPKAVYKEDLGQVVLPLPRGAHAADHVRKFLAEVVPDDTAPLAS
jgi:transcription-repair coupling factor (superfamily II helicase)